MKKLTVFLLAGLLAFGLIAQERRLTPDQERVISYHSDITINADASVDVTETIKVYANGVDIRRGIYRAYPTEYVDDQGFTISVGFEVLEVLRDGQQEPYHTESANNGKVVYIGDADVFLDPGEYTYTIRYRTDRQLGFFDDYDELYYNVNGTGWVLPMEKVSATVHLPAGAEVLQFDAYTGYEGDTGKDFEVSQQPGEISFATTRAFSEYENLTIAVGWSKGFVAEPPPGMWTKIARWLFANRIYIGIFGILALFLYWFRAWLKVGVDPPKGTIIPMFEPPKGFSPADSHFVYHMGYDKKALAADVVDLAVKGFLTIDYEKKKFVLTKKEGGDKKQLSPAQRTLYSNLFGSHRQQVVLEQTNHAIISRSIGAHEKSLRSDLDGVHFKNNLGYLLGGVLISLLSFLLLAKWGHEDTVFMLIWLSVWNIGVIALVAAAFNAFMNLMSNRSGIGAFIGLTLFSIPFVVADVFVLAIFFDSPVLMLIIFGHVAINALFIYLIKAPTVEGRRNMDHLEGFRLFLKKAEEHRLNQLQNRDTALQLFEKYLPFAIALDVENDWGKSFEKYFNMPDPSGHTYHPVWYHNSGMTHFSSNTFSKSIGSSLSSNISSSSHAPGSSSGSSGGGSSGGGGGGGGGGGW